MQFQYNADYPGIEATTGVYDPVGAAAAARPPLEFPPAQPVPCARLTTRIFHPTRNQVATVQNVIIRTAPMPTPRPRQAAQQSSSEKFDDGMLSSSSSSSSSDFDDDDDDMGLDDGGGGGAAAPGGGGAEALAYWVQRTIREAIYGRVLFAIVLKRRTARSGATNDNAEWEVTQQHVAIKEMSWQHIRRERDRLAEDPIKEVAAMQYLRKSFSEQQEQAQRLQRQSAATVPVPEDSVTASFTLIRETNIMMPLDLLSDDQNLYSIMPYCDGGELFERLDMNERFTEEEARYWMYQLLNGIENLQNAGVCHRDMSLENLLVHESGALIIDLGMCLRVPLDEPTDPNLQQQLLLQQQLQQQLYISGNAAANGIPLPKPANLSRARKRYLIQPQGTCGKWIYMSPEIYKNQEPFDGFAVDMWAAGVILFLMLTGFPPWERACQTDERFKYMSAGYLVQMLTEWQLPISADAKDLLQRMLFLDPKDRLSMDQVRAHPWMVNGKLQPPTDNDIFDDF